MRGNGITLGLTNGKQFFGSGCHSDFDYITAYVNGYGAKVGATINSNQDVTNHIGIGITTDATKSGIVADLSSAQISSTKLGAWFIKF